MTISDLVTDALIEIRVARAGDTLEPEALADGIRVLNRMLDLWNAERRAVYATAFNTYTVPTNTAPITIGPTGADFTVSQRPVSIDGANCILTDSTPDVNLPVYIRDANWWLNQRIPGLTNQLWVDLYYQPDWPNGNIYLWPVPTTAYDIQLMTRTVLAAVTATTTFSLPPGYQDAITLSLAERLATQFGQVAAPATIAGAAHARALIFANNDEIPRVASCDSGMPQGSAATRTAWSYRIGGPINQ